MCSFIVLLIFLSDFPAGGSIWQQIKKVSSDFSVPNHRFQLFLGDLQMFSGQLRDTNSLASPRVSRHSDMPDIALAGVDYVVSF